MENKVELLGIYGSDELIACSAWTSTSRDLTDEKRGRIGKLLNMLAQEGHHTPFEKSSIHFLAITDMATHIQLLKHRISVSINAESARYKELKDDKFYVPYDWPSSEKELYIKHMEECFTRYHSTLARLVAGGMSRKRAKESARFYIPYGNQLTCDIMFNFRSFAHFIGLRHKKDAQDEINRLSHQMLILVQQTGAFPLTLEAFGFTKNGIIVTDDN